MLIKNVCLLTGAENGRLNFIENACVRTSGDTITYAGSLADLQNNTRDCDCNCSEETIDGRGALAMPGLVNAHSHAPMTLLRGYGSDLNLHDWLTKKIFPAEALMTPEDAYYGALLAYLEMLRYGITASADMYMFPYEICDAADKAGIRASVVCPVSGVEVSDDAFRAMEKLYRDKHGKGLVTIMTGAHAEYTSTPAMIERLASLTRELGCAAHIHLSETEAEVKGCVERHGVSPVEYFRRLGLFDSPTLAAHCVVISDDDIQILRDYSVSPAHNPISNLKLASGISPVHKMTRQGVNVCLGTDGAASNNTLNMWEEIRLMAILHKGAAHDPTSVSPREVIASATVNGAKALGLERVGLIQEGYKADIILIDRSGIHHTPILEHAGDLVYATQGADVMTTIVNGVVRYKDGAFPGIDITSVRDKVCEAVQRLIVTAKQ